MTEQEIQDKITSLQDRVTHLEDKTVTQEQRRVPDYMYWGDQTEIVSVSSGTLSET